MGHRTGCWARNHTTAGHSVCACVCVVGRTVAKQPALAMWTVVWLGSPARFNKGVSGYIMARRKGEEKRQEVGRKLPSAVFR